MKKIKIAIIAVFVIAFGVGLASTSSVQAAPNNKGACESLGGSWHTSQETCSGYDKDSYCELTGGSAAECKEAATPPTNQPQCIDEGGSWNNNRCNGWTASRACSVSGGTWRSTGSAAANPFCDRTDPSDGGSGASVPTGEKECGGVTTSIISCNEKGGDGAPIEETGVWGILLLVVNILTAGVGVAALGGLIYGAVLYTSSGGSPDQIKKARNVFTNVVVGIIAFAAMYAVLNFIVPGGVFQ